MDNILVGFENSAQARRAARFAVDLASRTGASVTFAHVMPAPAPVPLSANSGLDPWHQEHAVSCGLLADLVTSYRSSAVTTSERLLFGSSADEFATAASEPGVGLVVVGAGRSGPVSSALLGSVTQRLLQRSARPVIVVPKGDLPAKPLDAGARILVGVDGSEGSLAAVGLAVSLAKATGTGLLLACAAAPSGSSAPPSRDEASAALRAAEVLTAGSGLSVELARPVGAAAEALCELARRDDVALVAVGHRGRGAVVRMLMGSVADRLARESTKPVLVARDRASAA